jgi:hypothetical protein
MSLVEGSGWKEVYPSKHVVTTSVDEKVSSANSLVMCVCGQSMARVVGPIRVAVVGISGYMGISRVRCGSVLIALPLLVEGGVGKNKVSSGLMRQVA